jgi:hypothetical protein
MNCFYVFSLALVSLLPTHNQAKALGVRVVALVAENKALRAQLDGAQPHSGGAEAVSSGITKLRTELTQMEAKYQDAGTCAVVCGLVLCVCVCLSVSCPLLRSRSNDMHIHYTYALTHLHSHTHVHILTHTELSIKRLTEVFRNRIQDFRDACFRLTGYAYVCVCVFERVRACKCMLADCLLIMNIMNTHYATLPTRTGTK